MDHGEQEGDDCMMIDHIPWTPNHVEIFDGLWDEDSYDEHYEWYSDSDDEDHEAEVKEVQDWRLRMLLIYQKGEIQSKGLEHVRWGFAMNGVSPMMLRKIVLYLGCTFEMERLGRNCPGSSVAVASQTSRWTS